MNNSLTKLFNRIILLWNLGLCVAKKCSCYTALGIGALVMLLALPVSAQPEGFTASDIEASVLEDPSDALVFDDINTADYDSEFVLANAADLTLGYKTTAHWIKIKVGPAIKNSAKNIIMEIAYSHLDDVQVFIVDDTRTLIQQYHIGDTVPFDQRPVVDPNFVFKLGDQTQQLDTIYFRVKTSGALQVPINFYNDKGYSNQRLNRLIVDGMYYGVFAAMFFYNVFILFSVRRIAYFYYVIYIFAMALHQLALSGLGFQYIWPNTPAITNDVILLSGVAIGFGILLFSRNFLELQESPFLLKVNNFFLASTLLVTIFCFMLPYKTALLIYVVYFVAYSFSAMLSGIIRYYQNFREARFYLGGWLVVVTATIVYVGVKANIIPVFPFSEYLIPAGTAWEALLLSFALGDRLNTLSTRLESANTALSNQNLALEQEVEKRTNKLSTTLEELKQANSRLQEVSVTDHLTGLFNRQHFDQMLDTEIKRTKRSASSLSLIILDIDYFKKINDTYGHIAGDQTLQTVAKCLMDITTRQTDILCRYGGEEFAIILTETDLSGATIFAEKIRKAIENLSVQYEGNTFSLSASFGVASMDKNNLLIKDALLKAADTALYNAKAQGRNQVHTLSA